MNGVVEDLGVSDGALFAAGVFTNAGGIPANYIAEWNGTNWSALGSGMNDWVYALGGTAGAMYAGGTFTRAGVGAFNYVVTANLPVTPAIITTNAAFGFTNGVFGFDVTGTFGNNVIIQTSPDFHAWFPLRTNVFGSGPLYFSDPQSSTNSQRYYRVAGQ